MSCVVWFLLSHSLFKKLLQGISNTPWTISCKWIKAKVFLFPDLDLKLHLVFFYLHLQAAELLNVSPPTKSSPHTNSGCCHLTHSPVYFKMSDRGPLPLEWTPVSLCGPQCGTVPVRHIHAHAHTHAALLASWCRGNLPDGAASLNLCLGCTLTVWGACSLKVAFLWKSWRVCQRCTQHYTQYHALIRWHHFRRHNYIVKERNKMFVDIHSHISTHIVCSLEACNLLSGLQLQS